MPVRAGRVFKLNYMLFNVMSCIYFIECFFKKRRMKIKKEKLNLKKNRSKFLSVM